MTHKSLACLVRGESPNLDMLTPADIMAIKNVVEAHDPGFHVSSVRDHTSNCDCPTEARECTNFLIVSWTWK